MSLPFLDDQNPEQSRFVLLVTRAEIVRSAVAEGLIPDDDLAMVPETMPVLATMVGTLRDDLYKHHHKIQKSIQFPLVANCFGYSFAKGAESAALWHASPKGQIEFTYLFDDAIRGAAGARVNEEFASAITTGMQGAYNVFVDFQDNVVKNPKHGFAQGGRLLADVFACGFFWASQVGLDYGMNRLGFP